VVDKVSAHLHLGRTLTKPASSPRLPSDERRDRILDAALQVFAERGFHGATTRELAKAAGVSEALMFRHFPTKEELYSALQFHCCRAKNEKMGATLAQLDDSTASLIALVHYMMAKTLRPTGQVDPREQALLRLLATSFLEDGSFARGFMENAVKEMIQKLQACLRAALAAGDAEETPIQENVGVWFVQHFAAMLMLNEMPGKPVVKLAPSRNAQIEQAVWFACQGLGLKAAAIRRHYRPQTFSLLMA